MKRRIKNRSQNKEKIKNVASCKMRAKKEKKEEFNIVRKEGVRKE